MSSCNPSVLVSSTYMNISLCKCCQRVGLFYNNLLVGFNPNEFKKFCKGVSRIDFDKNSVPFPNGLQYLIIDTCHPDIQFCFTKEEFSDLHVALQEAQLMIEVHESLEIDQ